MEYTLLQNIMENILQNINNYFTNPIVTRDNLKDLISKARFRHKN